MVICEQCSECLGACTCDVQGGYRYQDVEGFVWDFCDLVSSPDLDLEENEDD